MEQSPISPKSARHSFSYFQTRLCLIFQPLFSLRSWKPISFTLPFLLSLYSPRLPQNWYLRYWPSFVFPSHTHSCQFLCYLTCKCLWISRHFLNQPFKLVRSCLGLTLTLWFDNSDGQWKSPLLLACHGRTLLKMEPIAKSIDSWL